MRESLRNCVIPPVDVDVAAPALLLDVGHFTTGRQLAIAADDASAGECAKPEESDQTHCPVPHTLS